MTHAPIEVEIVPPEEVLALRDLYRQEMNCQIIHDSWHERRWCDCYLLRTAGRVAGYGFVGAIKTAPRELIHEFYVLPAQRSYALALFRRLIAVSGARRIETQTNDILLTLMLYDCAMQIESDTILFHDGTTTNLTCSDAFFRKATEEDKQKALAHTTDPGDYVLEVDGEILATGGLLFHYNVPYGDLYMEVAAAVRRRGLGSFLIQELKRTCYEMGRVPAARCNVKNAASRATLQRAGMLPCARMLTGLILPELPSLPDAGSANAVMTNGANRL